MIKLFAPVLRDALGALARRVGTGFSGFLLAQGVPPTQAEQAVLALAVLAGVSFDVAVSLVHKRGQL